MSALTPVSHGTLTGYIIHKCRCRPCRAANNGYSARVRRLRAYGRWQPLVDAQPVREHLRLLAAHGIGARRAARLAGVPTTTIQRLLHGSTNPPRPPTRRMRPAAAARILALRPTLDLLADGARTNATGTHRRIHALAAAGWPLSALATRLGADRYATRRILRAHQVSARTARTVAALYDQLWDQDPLTRGVLKTSAARARALASRNGWPPPAAWDDDTIDDPAARPDLGGHARRQDALLEDAQFIASTTGADHDQTAARLGITRDYYDKIRERASAAA